jgi:hypothetical protein
VVVVHDLVLLFEVIAFAVISLLVGLFLEVLLFATRVVFALIISRQPLCWRSSRTSVGRFDEICSSCNNDACGLSHGCKQQEDEPSSSPLAASSPRVKNTGRFVSSLVLLKKGHELKWFHGHHFVCFCKVKLMRLWLHKKDLFAFLLSHG